MKQLYPYQKKALAWAEQRDRIALFMQMRLGKTVICIRWVKFKNAKRVLVLAPLSVIPVWHKELQDEGIASSMVVGDRAQKLEALNLPVKWFLMNYEGLLSADAGNSDVELRKKRIANGIVDLNWDCVILDESTRARNPKAKLTKAIVNGFQDVKYRAILTGSPNPESTLDFFEQMRFLNGHFMGIKNYWTFRHIHYVQNFYDWVPKKGFESKVRQYVHRLGYFLTRKAAGVGPGVVHESRYVELPAGVRAAYKKAERDWELGDQSTKYILPMLTWLAQLTGGAHEEFPHEAKVKELRALLDGELSGEQVVIWFRFNAELFKVRKELELKKESLTWITGATPMEERAVRLQEFSKGKRRLLLVQAMCAQFGLDCSAADTAIYYSRWHSGLVNMQSADRIIHPAKKEPVLVIDLLAKNTIDEDVLKAVRNKVMNVKAFRNTLLSGIKERR